MGLGGKYLRKVYMGGQRRTKTYHGEGPEMPPGLRGGHRREGPGGGGEEERDGLGGEGGVGGPRAVCTQQKKYGLEQTLTNYLSISSDE